MCDQIVSQTELNESAALYFKYTLYVQECISGLAFPMTFKTWESAQKKAMDEKVIKLAIEFSRIIREWLTPEQMAVVEKDCIDTPNHGCATHDYCDSNMAMSEAFKTVLGIDFEDILEHHEQDPHSEENTALWNATWELARRELFYTKK